MVALVLLSSINTLAHPEKGAVCLRGGMAEYPCSGFDKCPPCWTQHSKGWSCFEKVSGKCPWQDMVDVKSSFNKAEH